MTEEELIARIARTISLAEDGYAGEWLLYVGTARAILPLIHEAELRGVKAGLDASAILASHHAAARRKAQDAAKKRHAKTEARDYESMAIEAVQIECAIRAIDHATVEVG